MPVKASKASPKRVSRSKSKGPSKSRVAKKETSKKTSVATPAVASVEKKSFSSEAVWDQERFNSPDHDLGPLPNDEVFDETDNAQHMHLRELADIQRRAREMSATRIHDPSFDGKHCVECEDEIPEKRLALGYEHCVVCQTQIEAENKRRKSLGLA